MRVYRGAKMDNARRVIRGILTEALQPAQITKASKVLGIGEEPLRDLIFSIDPTGERGNYATWIIKRLIDREDADEMRILLEKFHRAKELRLIPTGKMDIIRYSTLSGLRDVVDAIPQSALEVSKTQLKKARIPALTDISGWRELARQGGYSLIETASPAPCMALAQGTEVCIRLHDDAKRYLEHGPVYFVMHGAEMLYAISFMSSYNPRKGTWDEYNYSHFEIRDSYDTMPPYLHTSLGLRKLIPYLESVPKGRVAAREFSDWLRGDIVKARVTEDKWGRQWTDMNGFFYLLANPSENDIVPANLEVVPPFSDILNRRIDTSKAARGLWIRNRTYTYGSEFVDFYNRYGFKDIQGTGVDVIGGRAIVAAPGYDGEEALKSTADMLIAIPEDKEDNLLSVRSRFFTTPGILFRIQENPTTVTPASYDEIIRDLLYDNTFSPVLNEYYVSVGEDEKSVRDIFVSVDFGDAYEKFGLARFIHGISYVRAYANTGGGLPNMMVKLLSNFSALRQDVSEISSRGLSVEGRIMDTTRRTIRNILEGYRTRTLSGWLQPTDEKGGAVLGSKAIKIRADTLKDFRETVTNAMIKLGPDFRDTLWNVSLLDDDGIMSQVYGPYTPKELVGSLNEIFFDAKSELDSPEAPGDFDAVDLA
jgi:hypothetical protein